jgi:hypothetical protein
LEKLGSFWNLSFPCLESATWHIKRADSSLHGIIFGPRRNIRKGLSQGFKKFPFVPEDRELKGSVAGLKKMMLSLISLNYPKTEA